MFDDEVREQIFAKSELQKIDLMTLSLVIKAIEEAILMSRLKVSWIRKKGDEEVDTNDIHKTCEEIMGNCKKANTMSNIAIVCGILSILINVLTGIDKIESFAQSLLSYLH